MIILTKVDQIDNTHTHAQQEQKSNEEDYYDEDVDDMSIANVVLLVGEKEE
jgi:hypothetical protein